MMMKKKRPWIQWKKTEVINSWIKCFSRKMKKKIFCCRKESTKWVEDQTELLLQRKGNEKREKNCGGNLYNENVLIVKRKETQFDHVIRLQIPSIKKKSVLINFHFPKTKPSFLSEYPKTQTRVTRLHRHTNQDSDSRQRERGRSKKKRCLWVVMMTTKEGKPE